MRDFVILTDSSCDLPASWLKQHNVEAVNLTFTYDGTEFFGETETVDPKEFYAAVRSGKMPQTQQVNPERATAFIKKHLDLGLDVLLIGFSSGLSGTYASEKLAGEELAPLYPDQKIIVIDSLCAAQGQGLLLHYAVKLKEEGKSLDEVAAWVEENKLKIVHLVTIEDLNHLHRGGRISKASAVMGSVMGIKPVVYVDNEGKLVNAEKVRGRKQSLAFLVDQVKPRLGNRKLDYFMVGHGDCIEDAKYTAELMVKAYGCKDYLIADIGAVIGAHTGPGVCTVFFLGEKR